MKLTLIAVVAFWLVTAPAYAVAPCTSPLSIGVCAQGGSGGDATATGSGQASSSSSASPSATNYGAPSDATSVSAPYQAQASYVTSVNRQQQSLTFVPTLTNSSSFSPTFAPVFAPSVLVCNVLAPEPTATGANTIWAGDGANGWVSGNGLPWTVAEMLPAPAAKSGC